MNELIYLVIDLLFIVRFLLRIPTKLIPVIKGLDIEGSVHLVGRYRV